MELKIGNPVRVSNPTKTFELEFKVVHGDADGYSSEKLNFRETEKDELVRVLEIFNAMSGRDSDDYRNIPGFKEYVWDNYPTDYTCLDYPAALKYYQVFYYDENGIKHFVEIVK